MVPLHPQRCPGEPDRLRWIVPVGAVPVTGAPAAVPAALAALRADGTLAEIVVEPAAVLTRLGPGRDWTAEGPRVRTAIHAALDDPAGWRPANGVAAPPGVTAPPDVAARTGDAALRATAQELIDGPVNRFTRGHGGRIHLVEVRDGVVTVQLAGACHGCPAARNTLRDQLERELRRRCPDLRVVTTGP